MTNSVFYFRLKIPNIPHSASFPNRRLYLHYLVPPTRHHQYHHQPLRATSTNALSAARDTAPPAISLDTVKPIAAPRIRKLEDVRIATRSMLVCQPFPCTCELTTKVASANIAENASRGRGCSRDILEPIQVNTHKNP